MIMCTYCGMACEDGYALDVHVQYDHGCVSCSSPHGAADPHEWETDEDGDPVDGIRNDVVVCEGCGTTIADYSAGAARPPMSMDFCSTRCKDEWWSALKVHYEDPFDVY